MTDKSTQYQHAILTNETCYTIDMEFGVPITEVQCEAIHWLRELARRSKARRKKQEQVPSGKNEVAK